MSSYSSFAGLLGLATLFDETLGSDQATFDEQSISGDNAHMLIIGYLRGATAATSVDMTLRFNNDSGGNYDNQNLSASGASTPSASQSQGNTALTAGDAPGASASANRFGLWIAFIPNYANAANMKPIFIFNSRYTGTGAGTGRLQLLTGLWRSNNAINRITLIPSAGDWLAGSRFSGYGIG